MAKKKIDEPESGESSVESAVTEKSASPSGDSAEAGLKELPKDEADKMKAALKDGWTEREGTYINNREFNIGGGPGGVVPQGVSRPLEEAYALEVRRVG